MGATSNRRASQTELNFLDVPEPFRVMMKQVMFRYIMRGREGSVRPSSGTLGNLLDNAVPFLKFLHRLGIFRLSEVTPMVCSAYVQEVKSAHGERSKKAFSLSAQDLKFRAVEALYELSSFTSDMMPFHPWPESTALRLSGIIGSAGARAGFKAKTPLIPDDVLVVLFQKAWTIIENSERLFDLRDRVSVFDTGSEVVPPTTINGWKNAELARHGWNAGLRELTTALLEIRTACYIVVATLTGCRNHEMANVKRGSYYSTVDDDGLRYWWMRSESSKTYEGRTEWMVPEAAVTALRVMERWSTPFHDQLHTEIASLRATKPGDPKIAEAQRHLDVLFVGQSTKYKGAIRTVSGATWNTVLKEFAKACNLTWNLATHQLRRKFANYAARSQFGDLRYLKEHFKHWSMDMTLGYAMNESQEMALYLEIMDELDEFKIDVVDTWMDLTQPLSGGYGRKMVDWRARDEPIVLFKSRKQMVAVIAASTSIRSNGHAWCTADDNLCVGNDFEKTRCADCSGAVIGKLHSRIYQQMIDDLEELSQCEDIGEGGRSRVRRDLKRCQTVLSDLDQVAGASAT